MVNKKIIKGKMLVRAGRLLASLPRTSFRTLTPLRSVTSLGPLAAAFNAKPNGLTNGLAQWGQEKTGLFGIEELSTSEGFYHLKAKCIENASALVREACSDQRTRNVAVIFDDLSDELCRGLQLSVT